LLIVVAGSLALVYMVVIPSLESQLTDAKISQLEQAGRTLAPAALAHTGDDPGSNLWWEPQGLAVNARLVMFRVLARSPLTLLPIQDSRGLRNSSDVANDRLALKASALGEKVIVSPIHATVSRRGEHFAEVAVPFADGEVLLLSAPLSDTLDAVSVAKHRLLIAGGIALIAVFLVGYAAAWLFARRIKRLKYAAEQIAGGHFDEPIVDQGRDEVGEVARAFDHMRLRLSQLDRARREFIANASHELRTPLFSLGGFLELMDDEELESDTRREFLSTMRDQVRRLTKLALELLDLSRLDAGQMDVGREPVAVAGMARVVIDEFTAVAQQTGHQLGLELDEDAVALADEQRVVQIGRILVENALVHTPAGTHVRVRVAREANAVVLSVDDDGPGIRPEQASHVFDRFYRADGSQTSGSGLGLAIALELARLMDGTVELETRIGRTSFRLLLPSADAVEHVPPAPREPVGV
jgi:signal transduction histidine kinase